MVVAGVASPVEDPAMEAAQYYKASGIRVHAPATGEPCPPPWQGCPPPLEVYRARGPRRLDTKTYRAKCRGCLWGCDMPVEITVDQWNPKRLQHRRETFCYGPKSCPIYRAGPIRKVPGRKGMVWEEAEWVDEMNTEHRDWDE
ncbi:MAG: hypothetical protein H6534_06460 [Chthonomonadaceae bacterium]|nr:hypothetical protein [Chthonomonadaceae bacterium]